jgi:uncharacterized protein YjiS (DUF1127 family)
MRDGGSLSDAPDLPHPPPQAWPAQREGIVARGREERRLVKRHMADATLGVVRLTARAARRLRDALRQASRRYLARRNRVNELHELAAMSNRELRDIGISRGEIRSAIRSGAKRLSRDHLCRPS